MSGSQSPKAMVYWNAQGLIPGPEETEESYVKRVESCLNLKQNLLEHQSELPFQDSDSASPAVLQEAYDQTQTLYGIAPTWTPVFFSNYQLSPWQGACAWIFQLNAKTPTAAFLQLRSNFRTQSIYWGIYHRSELIAHELSHVGRMAYQEIQFEEFLAYQSSPSALRRTLGPLLQSSKESLFFILLLGLWILADLTRIIFNDGMLDPWISWVKWIPLLCVAYGLGRLQWRYWQFKRCLKKLKCLLQNSQTAQHLIYRLSDREIKYFANASLADIQAFIPKQQSFRWRFLTNVYKL